MIDSFEDDDFRKVLWYIEELQEKVYTLENKVENLQSRVETLSYTGNE